MKKSMKWALSLLAMLMIPAFQNCGGLESNGFAVQERSVAAVTNYSARDPSFFGYPYGSAPDLYADLQVIELAERGSMHNFKVIAAAAAADGSQSAIGYSFEIRDAAGIALCPQITGTLAPSYTTITGSCVSRQALAGAKARLTLSAGSKTQTVERQY